MTPVTVRATCVCVGCRGRPSGRPTRSPQRELHRHFDDDVDRLATPARRRELPLAHGSHRPLIETGAQALQDGDVADAAIAAHDDLEDHVTGNPAPSRIVGVIRLDLAEQPWRVDTAARTERSAAGAAARAVADTRAETFAAARALAGAGAPASARALALTRLAALLDDTFAVAVVGCSGHDRGHEDA